VAIMKRLLSPVLEVLTLIVAAAGVFAASAARGQVFEPTSGSHAWNDNNNWGPAPPQPFPDGAGASVTLPAPTGALSIELGQPITIGSLTINKSTTGSFVTTVTGTSPNGLTFDGGGTIATTASFADGGGLSHIAAPVSFSGPLTVTQGDDHSLRFSEPLSGAGSVNVNRDTNGEQFVEFNAANSYAGSTTVTGNAGTAFTVLRLNEPNAIPGGLDATGGASNITLTNSGILGLGSTDLRRSIGAGVDQIQFTTALNSGFAAFGGTRVVNFGGAAAPVTWSTAGFGTLTFGNATANGTVDFQNPLSLGNANRTIRAVDGSAAIDGKISASITSTGAASNLTKTGGGTLSLAAANSYTGNTIVNAGALRFDHPEALPATSNVALSGGGIWGLGVADFNGTVGTGAGQVQFGVTGAGNGNAGFAAYGGDRKVTFNGGAPLVWGVATDFTVVGNFILSDDGADSLVEFTNAIDLNGASRTFAGRDGTPAIDSKVSGVVSGAGEFIKTQPGTLELSAANTYTGTTRASGGVLLLTNAESIPGGINGGSVANVVLEGGVLGLGQGDFTAPTGSGAGQVLFGDTENGGFAAFGGHRKVNLGGDAGPVVWGVDGFATGNLILSWAGSDGLIEFVNPIDLNGAARTFAGRNGTAAIDSRVSGVVSGVGGVIKTQPGTLEFTAANAYDGGTVIDAGRLLANNSSGSAFGSGDVTVNADGTLGGTGFIGVAGDPSNVIVNAEGRIAPGASVGKLTVAGDVTWQSGSFFDVELAGVTPETQFDKLVIDGAATLAGTLHVDLLDGFIPAVGTTFEVLTASGGVTGTFADVTWSGSTSWEVQYGPNSATLVAAAPSFEADYDEDGDVDSDDLNRWTTNFGTGTAHAQGDGDADCDVDGSDFLLWQRQLGGGVTPPTGAAATAVPEPAGLIIFAFGALFTFFPAVRALVRGATIHLKPGA